MTTASPYALYLSRLSENSQRSIHSQMRSIAKLMNWDDSSYEDKLSEVDYEQILVIRSCLTHACWSPRSINRAVTAIKNIVKTAALLGQAEVKQASDLQSVKQMKFADHQGTPLTSKQVNQLFILLDFENGALAARNRAIFALFLGTGLRRSELADLKLADYNPNDHSLSVIGKGNKYRVIFLPKWVTLHLEQWLKHRGKKAGYLMCWCAKQGKTTLQRAMSHHTLYRLENTLKKIGIQNASPHDLRRTYVTRLLEQGIDINTVRQMAGHANVATTTIYDKRDQAVMKKAAEQLSYQGVGTARGKTL
ncbi:site-specific integrase [Parashewanella curva]|uniref:Site-specific integrase n=1 Tax=Parashewanella curva TaxID=2338552 RepID=A0A3L8PQY8_9GAMM|nr:site-specific integrase [Parashewanella curva]RLV57766.1 site-specific integrase [Parashewanella curva]